jgi:hypothetical protein
MADTVAPYVRAWQSSSSDVVVKEPFDGSATTQIVDNGISTSLQNFD